MQCKNISIHQGKGEERKMIKLFATILLASTMISCGGSGGSTANNTQGNTDGTITLSGDDTSVVGTKLDTGFVGSSLAAGSQPDYIVIVDKSSSVTFSAPNILVPNINDFNNGFVLVVTDDSAGSGIKGISMSIIVGGTKLDYACSTPVTTFIECGTNSITLDIGNKTVSFNTATVINTATGTTLTLNGTLVWNANGSSSNNGNSNGNTGGALTDITGIWKDDNPATYWSDLGSADEVYVIYKQDGTYLDFDYYQGIDCYRKSSGSYEDRGNGNISLDNDPPYQFSITGTIMTVSYLGDSYTATKSNLTESDFTPSCD